METVSHSMPELFEQLGLPSDEVSIRQFIKGHSPLPETVRLPDAPFWTPAQAAFLREEWRADADWAELIDQLNLSLRG
ncbi:DUF2789 domain-containing protein [Uliginosibacterium sp. H1]|uniref:DUF2789 domain-containing protein n=1 Tax=Uliginosibacterium sp. H1 TaxID=3114757 RepID=UPI002E182EA0|nr:DUF2789 domain-containing protein [Uliginosibacterium sp. H1]